MARADGPGVAGDWQGDIVVAPMVNLKAVIHVKDDKGKLTATFDSPDQGAFGMPIDSASLEKGEFVFSMKQIGGSYKGTLDKAGDTIDGTWTQAGRDMKLVLKRAKAADLPKVPMVSAEDGKKIQGIWQGRLKVNPVISLRLVFRVKVAQDGRIAAVMESPDQTPAPIPVSNVQFAQGEATFEVKSAAGKFTGKLNDAGSELIGKWSQGGNDLPLTLTKTEKVEEPKRPQTPKPPFSYKAEDVKVENKAAGLTLAGTLTLPKGSGPFPAAIMITGSGAQDRDETLFAHKPFLVIADALTKAGIAVLRCDDRGTGASTGDFGKATSVDFATDVKAQLDYLKGRKDIDAKKIGLIGHSEGGLIAPMVAAERKDVGYIVLLAGTGLDGMQILKLQNALILKAMGMPEEEVKQGVEVLAKALDLITKGPDGPELDKKLDAILNEQIAREKAAKKAKGDTNEGDDASTLAQARAGFARLKSPWMTYFLGYDPRPALRKVTCPVLAVNGEKDLQVPPKENLAEIEKALKEAGNSSYKIVEFPNLNHLFQTSKTGSPTEYPNIEETVAEPVLKVLTEWVVETTRH